MNVLHTVKPIDRAKMRTVSFPKEFQFIYAASGSLTVHTLSETLQLSEGEALYLGPEIIHRIEASVDTHYYNFLFPAGMLRFYPSCPANEDLSSFFAENSFSFAHLSPKVPWAQESLEILKDLSRFEEDKPHFYAYEVLLRLFKLLLLKKHSTGKETPRRGANAEKAKIILKFIADHYDEDISLKDMAESTHLSESGCLRAFRLSMHTTPYQYLLEYRLQKAAEKLLATDLSIGQIALDTGFRQVSLFGKYFKAKTGFTPKEYRAARS